MLDIKGILDPIVAIINKVVPDKSAAAAAVAQLQLLQAQGAINEEMAQLVAMTSAQTNIDQAEAGNASTFVAGWRPAVGWICAAGLGYVALVEPLARFIATVGFKYAGTYPVIDTSITMQVLLGMLGLGGMRTYEKVMGVSNGNPKH